MKRVLLLLLLSSALSWTKGQAIARLPVLLQPAKDAELDGRIAQNVIVFRFTSLVPLTVEVPQYRVQVFEVLPGQTPMQAFRGNRPVLDDRVARGMTQYIWRTQLPMADSTMNRQFIWTVQTLDRAGRAVSANDPTVRGRSEPSIFYIRR